MIRVLIVAPAARTRRALESQLHSQGFEVAGSLASLVASEEFAEREVQAILIDAGDAALDEILESLEGSGVAHETPTVLLLASAPPEIVSQALRLGVRGILPADAELQQLAAALQAVASGLLVLAPTGAAVVRAETVPRTTLPDELPEALTPRELEVIRLMAAGLGNKEIAAKLKISEHTAKFHVASILGKLGASSRTEAVSLGMRRGLILL